MNLPAEEMESSGRLGFQLEQAWWFYDDFFRAENPSLTKMNLKRFAVCLLDRYPAWKAANSIDSEQIITDFLRYKSQVPTCGAILLNPQLTKCLMVKGWGPGATWGFPKGKIAKGETPEQCAAREVSEEIGHEITGKFSPEDFVQTETGPHAIRLYLVPGIPETTQFQTLTRKEISDIRWFSLGELSSTSSNQKFYNVVGYIGRLKAWIKRHRKASSSPEGQPPALPRKAASPPADPAVRKERKPPAALAKPVKRRILAREQPALLFKFDCVAIEAAFDASWKALPPNC